MRYLSVCSGIEAATVAAPEGWHAAAFAEVDPFPSAVLAHRFPTVPNLGDFTKIEAADVGAIDLLVGGTPCQSFSIAGKRAGLDDPRGNLTVEFLALAKRLQPRYIIWENVPGVLSIDGGRTFGAFLGMLGQLGYGFAFRILNSEFFGVPQRRSRVFVVGCAGADWQRASAILFEPESLRRHPAESRRARQDSAGALGASSGGADDDDAADGRLIAHSLRGEGHDASEDGTGRGTPLVSGTLQASGKAAGSATQQDAESGCLVAFGWQNSASQGDSVGTVSPALDKSKTPAVFGAVQITSKTNRSRVTPGAPAGTLSKASDMHAITNGVRRLTPTECERLQGFPDNWTAVPYRNKPAEDGPRYKAIGNSMAVPVMRWIFNRLDIVDKATAKPKANTAGLGGVEEGERL